MTTYLPLHDVTDEAKLDAMIESIRTGGSLPPILVCGGSCLTGSHRHEAYIVANRNIRHDAEGWDTDTLESFGWSNFDLEMPVVVVSDADYQRACMALDIQYNNETEPNLFCAALAAVTSDDEVRRLADDQTHDESLSRDQLRRAAAIRRLSDERVEERRAATYA